MRAKSQLPSRLLLGNRFSQFDSSPVRRARRQDPVRQAVRALVERMEQRVLLTHALPMFELDGDGMIVAERLYWNVATLMEQIGAGGTGDS